MSRTNKIVFAVMLAIGCGIFAYESRTLQLNQLVADISRLKVGWLLVALLCMLVSWFFEALVLRVFLKGRTTDFSLFNALRIPLIAQLFNAIYAIFFWGSTCTTSRTDAVTSGSGPGEFRFINEIHRLSVHGVGQLPIKYGHRLFTGFQALWHAGDFN